MMKKFLYFAALFSVGSAFAQNEFLDYVVKNNDTIYGTIREIAPADFVLTRTVTNNNQSPVIGLRGAKSIRFNDKIYSDNLSGKDPIYAAPEPSKKRMISYKLGRFSAAYPQLQDYIVKDLHDTIFGKIEVHKNELKLISGSASYPLDDNVWTYRYNNDVVFKSTSDDRPDLKLLLGGTASLFEYQPRQGAYNKIYVDRYRMNDVIYYVENKSAMFKITPANFPDSAIEAFADNQKLVDLIRNNTYGYENMYLITKYYNAAK